MELNIKPNKMKRDVDEILEKKAVDRIKNALDKFARIEGFTILHAVMGGSRYFGWYSVDSDYDVYVVYYHNIEQYLTIGPEPPQTIEHSFAVDNINIIGYDLRKVLKLVRASNKYIIEMLMFKNPIIECKELHEIARKSIRYKPTAYGYLKAAQDTLKRLKSQPKRYFPTIMGILMLMELQNDTFVNTVSDGVTFLDLIHKAPIEIAPLIVDIMTMKKSGKPINVDSRLHEWVLHRCYDLEKIVQKLPKEITPSVKDYDQLFFTLLFRESL